MFLKLIDEPRKIFNIKKGVKYFKGKTVNLLDWIEREQIMKVDLVRCETTNMPSNHLFTSDCYSRRRNIKSKGNVYTHIRVKSIILNILSIWIILILL